MSSLERLRLAIDMAGLSHYLTRSTESEPSGLAGWYASALRLIAEEVAAGRATVDDGRAVRAEIHEALAVVPGLQVAVSGAAAETGDDRDLLLRSFDLDDVRPLAEADPALHDRVVAVVGDGFELLHGTQEGGRYVVLGRGDRMSSVRVRENGDVPERQLVHMAGGLSGG